MKRKKTSRKPVAHPNPLANIDDGLVPNPQRDSHDLIYESVMRGGGEAFGRPWSIGLSSLTDKVVKLFKLRGFFGFETLEQAPRKRYHNKFTQYGSSRHHGNYELKQARRAWDRFKERQKEDKEP